MSRRGIIQNAVVIVLGLAIISMSVGYAAFDTNLNISGSTTIQKANWDVHLENPVKTVNSTVTNEQVTIKPRVNEAGTGVSFAVNMKPGDVYEFTVDVKNAGSFNAKLSNYSLLATQGGQAVTVADGKMMYENADLVYEVLGVSEGEALDKGALLTKTIRITAKDADLSQVTEEAVSYEFKFNMNYVQNN